VDKINIRYIQQGLVKVDKPKNWDTMTNKQKEEYCDDVLYNLDDRSLVEGMSEVYPFSVDCFFADTPSVEAIELDVEDGDDPIPVATTKAWDSFVNDMEGLLWEHNGVT